MQTHLERATWALSALILSTTTYATIQENVLVLDEVKLGLIPGRIYEYQSTFQKGDPKVKSTKKVISIDRAKNTAITELTVNENSKNLNYSWDGDNVKTDSEMKLLQSVYPKILEAKSTWKIKHPATAEANETICVGKVTHFRTVVTILDKKIRTTGIELNCESSLLQAPQADLKMTLKLQLGEGVGHIEENYEMTILPKDGTPSISFQELKNLTSIQY